MNHIEEPYAIHRNLSLGHMLTHGNREQSERRKSQGSDSRPMCWVDHGLETEEVEIERLNIASMGCGSLDCWLGHIGYGRNSSNQG